MRYIERRTGLSFRHLSATRLASGIAIVIAGLAIQLGQVA